MNLEEKITKLQEDLQRETERVTKLIVWLRANAEKIEAIGVLPTLYGGGTIDFDNANREQVLAIIKAFPGKWEKSQNGTSMDYLNSNESNEFPIRIWKGALPPCCRIVKEEIDVPAHKETRERIVCNE